MAKQNRWVLLEHSGSPLDQGGIHFDLLLEDGDSCRTWRLPKIPLLDGEPQEATPLVFHRLEWLEKSSGEIF